MIHVHRLIVAAGVIAMGVTGCAAMGDYQKLNAGAITEAAGTKASITDDGVVRIGWARGDVEVTVDGMKFPPVAGLGSWAAFMPAEHGAMVMGDTVVFQDEVSPAMDAAFAHGLEVTALHNHFFFDEPKVYFMHIGGLTSPSNNPQPHEFHLPHRRFDHETIPCIHRSHDPHRGDGADGRIMLAIDGADQQRRRTDTGQASHRFRF